MFEWHEIQKPILQKLLGLYLVALFGSIWLYLALFGSIWLYLASPFAEFTWCGSLKNNFTIVPKSEFVCLTKVKENESERERKWKRTKVEEEEKRERESIIK